MWIWLKMLQGMKNCIWLEPQISAQDVVGLSSAGSVGQRLTGHLWASQSCCDCVISLLMKKPGETFDLENTQLVERLNKKPNHQMTSFLFFFFFLSYHIISDHVCFSFVIFQQSLSCVERGMRKTAYCYCWTSPVAPVIPRGLKWVKWFVCFFERVLERGSGIKVDANH